MSNIKRNRAFKNKNYLPSKHAHLSKAIPDTLVDMLTSKQLEAVIEVMDNYYHQSKREAIKNILAEKEVWSDEDQCFYDLVKAES
ncbi:hypothetical protein [Thiolinea disciformis]|uniref:hypothetical protein n=1 Tax=Thiolinea disciformis TaxID=125614 RepID=UPI000370420C|nr:hypothetical protein [Thiolinea disciformis]